MFSKSDIVHGCIFEYYNPMTYNHYLAERIVTADADYEGGACVTAVVVLTNCKYSCPGSSCLFTIKWITKIVYTPNVQKK